MLNSDIVKTFLLQEDWGEYEELLEEMFLAYVASDNFATRNMNQRINKVGVYSNLKWFINKIIATAELEVEQARIREKAA